MYKRGKGSSTVEKDLGPVQLFLFQEACRFVIEGTSTPSHKSLSMTTDWILDSGASHHMTGWGDLLVLSSLLQESGNPDVFTGDETTALSISKDR